MKKLSMGLGILLVSPAFYAQDVAAGLSAASQYSFKTAHLSPSLTGTYKSHMLYVGPDVTFILKPLFDPVDPYEKQSFGIQFGYRNAFYSKEHFFVYCQLHFVAYRYTFEEWSLGNDLPKQQQKTVWENSGSFGIGYRLTNDLAFFAAAGVNSYNGFFLIPENFAAAFQLGLQYDFRKNE